MPCHQFNLRPRRARDTSLCSTLSPIATDSNPPSALEVLIAFLRLGCLSFGGPVAHLGYFHAEFVQRRRWLAAETYAELVAIAQSLPGPASSQVAFAIGLLRASWLGSLAAWTGFTLPSAALLFAFACGHSLFTGRFGASILLGLQLVAVAIVAQAVLTMQRSLAPDLPRLVLASVAAAVVFFSASPFATVQVLISAAAIGLVSKGRHSKRSEESPNSLPVSNPAPATRKSPLSSEDTWSLPINRTHALIVFALFLALLLLLPPIATLTGSSSLTHFNAFYRAGALVFGGGHVVLPLLERAVVTPGWVDPQSFLAGYGLAQAVPGPLFTFAAYLGAALKDPVTNAPPISLAARAANSALALAAIFIPGLLLMLAALPFWATLGQSPRLRAALRAVNASVVGILFAALIRPVGTTALHASPHIWIDAALVVAAFITLTRFKAPPWTVVVTVVLVTAALSTWR